MKNKTTLTMLSAVIAVAIMAMSAFSQNFTVARNMGATLNTTSDDQNPVISPSGLSLYFSSDRQSPGTLDIWVSQRATLGSPWGAPQNLGVLNSIAVDSGPNFSVDGRTLFLQSNRSDSLGANDIYISTRTNPNDDFGWTVPINLGPVVNSPLNDGQPNYFEDPATGARTLIFTSTRVGNPMFDFHLYQSTRNGDGTFNPPTAIEELGTVGGTAELGSTIRRDGLEIFFASTRPGGLNPPLFDIWVSNRVSTSAPWNAPALVPGINTLDEERQPKLSPDGSILYFQSNRAGSSGLFDLYSATRCSLYSAQAFAVQRFTCF